MPYLKPDSATQWMMVNSLTLVKCFAGTRTHAMVRCYR
jgi:hypothetical protein